MTATQEVAFGLKPTTPAQVAKAIVYIALAALTILVSALGDDHLSIVELIQVGIVVAGAIPVYLLAGRWPKTIAVFVVAAGQAVVLLIADGATLADVGIASWLGVIVTAFGAIGVHLVPNSPAPQLGRGASLSLHEAAQGSPYSAHVSGSRSAPHVSMSIPQQPHGAREGHALTDEGAAARDRPA